MLRQIGTTLRNTMLYSIGNISVKIIGIILLPLYSKYFPVSEYGLLALFEVTSDFFIAIATLGLDHGLRRWYWEKKDRDYQRSLFFTYYIFTFFAALLFGITGYFVIGHFREEIFNYSVSNGLLTIFFFNVIIKLMVTKLLLLMRVKQEALNQTKHLLIYLGISLACIVVFITAFNLGIEAIFLGQSIGFTVIFLMLLPYLQKNLYPKFQTKLFKEMLGYSAPLALSAVLGLILTLSDRFIIKHFLTLADVGNYSIAYKVSTLTKMIIVTSFIQAFAYTYYRQMYSESSRRFLAKIYSYYTIAAVYFSLFLSIFAIDIIKLITLNEDYQQSIEIIPVLCLGIVFSGSHQILALPLKKHKKTAVISTFLVFTAILNIGLNIMLIPVMGNQGAAFSTMASQFFLMTVFLIYSRKTEKIKFEYLRLAVIYILGIVLYFVCGQINTGSYLLSSLIKLILCIGFPFYLYFLKLYEPVEMKRFYQLWLKWRDPRNWKSNLANAKD